MDTITIIAEESKNLDTVCYRGSAPLSTLTRISQADVFDQVANPAGLQRELNKKHAADAYGYVARPRNSKLPRAYPEVLLNVRDKKAVEREVVYEDNGIRLVKLTFDADKILDAKRVKVSRVDGNHRLFFTAGDGKERGPIDLPAPFSLTIGLTREQETAIFSDVNAEQKGLNTSHLAALRSRITPEEIELSEHPARVFARRLATDEASPWHELVHMGGPRSYVEEGKRHRYPFRPATFIALEHGVQRILRKSQYLSDREPEQQYGLLRNFWQAVQVVFPDAWQEPREYLVLKNLGVQVFSQVGAEILDKCLVLGNIEIGHMVPMMQAVKPVVDWHKDSTDTAGMSGNRAVRLLASKMAAELPKTAEAYVDPERVATERAAQQAAELEAVTDALQAGVDALEKQNAEAA